MEVFNIFIFGESFSQKSFWCAPTSINNQRSKFFTIINLINDLRIYWGNNEYMLNESELPQQQKKIPLLMQRDLKVFIVKK
jgi:hypothetical protein